MRLDVVTLCLVLCAQGCTLLLTPLVGDDAGGGQDSDVDGDVRDDADAPDTRDSDAFDVDIDRFDADDDDDDDADDADDADEDDADEDEELPPAASCAELLSRDSDLSDGEYDIFVGGSYVSVYCDMLNEGWTRVVHFDAAVHDCPGDWFSNDAPDVCRLDIDGCGGNTASAYFNPDLEEYREVRGYARAYQYDSTDGFNGGDIDEAYVEGLSITYGSPRQHIWTLAIGLMMYNTSGNSCPCLDGIPAPAFVEDHYYCESGNPYDDWYRGWYTDNPLWGGGEDADCGIVEEPGWFETDLGTTVSDSIEVRILQGGCDENTGVYELVLFVR